MSNCPKCKGKKTHKASKLGMYAGCWFCLDCAIYYNKPKIEVNPDAS